MTKIADDTYLLVGSRSIGTLVEEFDNIKKWAENNNMKIHPSKTKELIVSRARSTTTQVPLQPFIEGAERVTTLRVLGVILDAKLTMSDHISLVLSACASSTFALRLLQTHGLKQDELHLEARATTVASILYASPTWWGFAGEGHRQRLGRLLSRMHRGVICPLIFQPLSP